MSTEVHNLCCPQCGAVVVQIVRQHGFRVGGSSIGPSAIPCHACGLVVETGNSEWIEKSWLQKATFLVPRFFWLIFGVTIVAGMPSIAVGGFVSEQHRTVTIVATYVLSALLIGWMLIRNTYGEIRSSLQRTSASDEELK